MRVLIVGPYPPESHDAAWDARTVHKEQLAAGHEVTVVSPRESAADQVANLAGARGSFSLLRRSRRFDQLIICLDREMFLAPRSRRWMRLVDCLAFAFVLRLNRSAELRIADLVTIPMSSASRPARLVWAAAPRIVVAHDRDRVALVGAGGCSADRVVVNKLTRPEQVPGEDSREDAVAVEPGDLVDYGDLSGDLGEIQHQIQLHASQ